MDYPKVSIIIPLYVICDRFFEDLQHFSKLDYPNYEILIVCDKKIDISLDNAKLILTDLQQTGPAEKRDIALKEAEGDLLAFIDDDAYPDRNWLKNAVKYFDNPDIGAVGGPGITPSEDTLMQKAGGAVYESILGSGQYRYRFVPLEMREVDDYPAYNLLIRKALLKKIGGFASRFYGGEDTKVCLSIVNAGKNILYDPAVIVYHHRRPLFREHLAQIANVGIHRGYFAKTFPETSLRISYFLPSALSLSFGAGLLLSVFSTKIATIFLCCLTFLFLTSFFSALRKNLFISLFASTGIIATHLVYGVTFLRGLTLDHLRR